MSKEKIQSLIDRVIGKEGILRTPSYWMRKIFNDVLDYTDDSVAKSAKTTEANAKRYADEVSEAIAKEYGVTGNELKYYTLPTGVISSIALKGEGGLDTYTFTTAEANEWKKYKASPNNVVVRIKLSDDSYINAAIYDAKGVLSSDPGVYFCFRFEWTNLTSWFISEGQLTYHQTTIMIKTETNGTVTSSTWDLPIALPMAVDSTMSSESIQPVQNKIVKKYIDGEVTRLTNEMSSNEEVIAASLNELRDKIIQLENKLNS